MLRPRRSPRPVSHSLSGASPASPGSPDTLVPAIFGAADAGAQAGRPGRREPSLTPYHTPPQTPRGGGPPRARPAGGARPSDPADAAAPSSGGERVVRLQQQRLQLFQAWLLWRTHTWAGVQSNYAVKLEAMQERIAALKESAPLSPDASLVMSGERAGSSATPDGEVRTFVVNSPPRYRSRDVLLNKLFEAQIFIQQAVAENTAIRNYVHLLRAVQHWRLSVAGACRKRQLLKRILLHWAKGALAKAMRPWIAAAQVDQYAQRAVMARVRLRQCADVGACMCACG